MGSHYVTTIFNASYHFSGPERLVLQLRLQVPSSFLRVYSSNGAFLVRRDQYTSKSVNELIEHLVLSFSNLNRVFSLCIIFSLWDHMKKIQ